MLSYVDEPNEPYVLCLCQTLLGTARIPTECPLPHLEMLWRGKKSPAPGHNGNLTFAAATQDITSPPSYLPPRVPQLCSQPLSPSKSQVRSTRETLLGPPYLRSFYSLLPITTVPIGTSCKHGDRREGDRSVSSPSSPDGLPLPVPLLQLQLARPTRYHELDRTRALPSHIHCALRLETQLLPPPDRLPSSIVAVPVLNGSLESGSRPARTTC